MERTLTGPNEMKTPRVFVSYARDGDDVAHRMRQLADSLNRDGLCCSIDQYAEAEQVGDRSAWMAEQIRDADFILVVCTQAYYDAWEQSNSEKLECKQEIVHIKRSVHQNGTPDHKYVPVLLSPDDACCIPVILASCVRYTIDTSAGYKALYQRLAGQLATPAVLTASEQAETGAEREPCGAMVERVTVLLSRARGGDVGARERLAEVTYHELRRVAANRLRARRSRALDTTDLVHLAYERLLERGTLDAVNRRHLFAIFARAMNELLIDQWRAENTKKRGRGRRRVELGDEIVSKQDEWSDNIPELLSALDELRVARPEDAEVVSLKYLCGLTLDEIQDLTGLSLSQVRTKWENSRRWLYARIESEDNRRDS